MGYRLKQLREAQGLTQTELGQRIGRKQPEIHRWEIGRVRIPADELPGLARALDCTIDAFFVGEAPEGPAIDWELQLASRRLPEEARQRLREFLQSFTPPPLLDMPAESVPTW